MNYDYTNYHLHRCWMYIFSWRYFAVSLFDILNLARDSLLKCLCCYFLLSLSKLLASLLCVCVCVRVCVCVCVCLYSSTCWLLLAARRLWHTWEDGSTIFCCEYFAGYFCQVPSSQYLNLSYFTSEDENSSPQLTGEKTNDITSFLPLYEKMIYWCRI